MRQLLFFNTWNQKAGRGFRILPKAFLSTGYIVADSKKTSGISSGVPAMDKFPVGTGPFHEPMRTAPISAEPMHDSPMHKRFLYAIGSAILCIAYIASLLASIAPVTGSASLKAADRNTTNAQSRREQGGQPFQKPAKQGALKKAERNPGKSEKAKTARKPGGSPDSAQTDTQKTANSVGEEGQNPQDIQEESGEPGTEFLTPAAVQAGIEGAIDYLRRNQRGGAWEEYPGYEPGTTALCLLALLSADLTAKDKTVAAGLDYLAKFTPKAQNQTYPIALQTMVFCQADPEKYRSQIQTNVDWIIERQFKTDNVYRGGWSYTGMEQAYSMADNSNSQFAVLALYEAEKIGVKIPREVWGEVNGYWTRLQNADGSWGYRGVPEKENSPPAGQRKNNSGNGTGSMTCAGIVALLVTGARRAEGASVDGNGFVCCTDNTDSNKENDQRIDKALDWLAEHFSVRTNPGTSANADTYIFYYLYGLERTGRLSARRFIGQSDWYREGAEFLLRRKGSFSQYWRAGLSLERSNIVATSFALLFLSKGRWPVLVSKLKYDSDGDMGTDGTGGTETGNGEGYLSRAEWNQHPNDLDHLTRYAESQWGRKMTWQVIDSKRAGIDDYMQTPVLSISGRFSPMPKNGQERARLVGGIRGFLEQGGFLMGEALDNDVSFQQGFLELIKEVFPEEPNGGLHLLPTEHPIWNMEKNIPPESTRPLYGVDFGCRTSVVFIPSGRTDRGTGRHEGNAEAPAVPGQEMGGGQGGSGKGNGAPSLSCLWELANNFRRDIEYSDAVQAEINAGLDIGLNILAYATGRNMKYKEEIPESADTGNQGTERNDFYAAILDLGGGSVCAPRAIPNLMKKINSELGIPAQTKVNRVRPDSAELFESPLLFLHGRNEFTLGEQDVLRLRNYFDWGGFLFANSICASGKFTRAFAAEMKKVFPDSEIAPIPPDDPIYTNRYGGWNIREIEVRLPKRQSVAAGGADAIESAPAAQGTPPVMSSITKGRPKLFGIQREGRWVVVFSPYDVSCALENSGAAECPGYSSESAYRLSVNIVLYAMEHL